MFPKECHLWGATQTSMAKTQFKHLPLNSPSLFPQDIFEKIPMNHPVRLMGEWEGHGDKNL